MARYLAFNKPFEVLSQFTDSRGRATLADFISIPGIYAAGRLDYRSEGLLILSDDGTFIHQLTQPKFKLKKTYFAQVEGIVSAQALADLNQNILLPGIQTTLPEVTLINEPQIWARPVPVRDYHPTSWLQVKLVEGKKHQVRRMTAAAGYPTLRLVRVAIGSLTLKELQPGKWRDLTPTELRQILNNPGLPDHSRVPQNLPLRSHHEKSGKRGLRNDHH